MSALRREPSAAERIPCVAHVAPNVVKTTFGDYLQVMRLGGASFESSDEYTLSVLRARSAPIYRLNAKKIPAEVPAPELSFPPPSIKWKAGPIFPLGLI